MSTLKNNLTASSETENMCASLYIHLFLVTHLRENSHTCAQEDIHKDANCKLFNSEKVETTQTLTEHWLNNCQIFIHWNTIQQRKLINFKNKSQKRKLQKYLEYNLYKIKHLK